MTLKICIKKIFFWEGLLFRTWCAVSIRPLGRLLFKLRTWETLSPPLTRNWSKGRLLNRRHRAFHILLCRWQVRLGCGWKPTSGWFVWCCGWDFGRTTTSINSKFMKCILTGHGTMKIFTFLFQSLSYTTFKTTHWTCAYMYLTFLFVNNTSKEEKLGRLD